MILNAAFLLSNHEFLGRLYNLLSPFFLISKIDYNVYAIGLL